MSYYIGKITDLQFIEQDPVSGRWQRSKPLRCKEDYSSWVFRLKEAWEVFRNRAIAVTYDEPKLNLKELP